MRRWSRCAPRAAAPRPRRAPLGLPTGRPRPGRPKEAHSHSPVRRQLGVRPSAACRPQSAQSGQNKLRPPRARKKLLQRGQRNPLRTFAEDRGGRRWTCCSSRAGRRRRPRGYARWGPIQAVVVRSGERVWRRVERVGGCAGAGAGNRAARRERRPTARTRRSRSRLTFTRGRKTLPRRVTCSVAPRALENQGRDSL